MENSEAKKIADVSCWKNWITSSTSCS